MAVYAPAPAEARAPFFPADAAVRRIHNEGVLILGGARALLMQVAHPKVAQSVAEHSSYRGDRMARLLRTLRATYAIVYGTQEEASAAAAGINRLHERVKGEGYRALDPELLSWVLATLIDTTVVMHQRFLSPLAAGDAAAYYGDIGRIGAMLGIPEGYMPGNLPAMQAYIEEMSSSLPVSEAARTIAADLFAPLPGTGPSMLLMRQLTSGLLHPALREGYGLAWGPMREAELRVLQALSRALLPHMPLPLRRTPAFLLP